MKEHGQGHIESLDGLRAVAILMIMAYHANLLSFAWVSMQLFFVLSGFLITGILWSEKQKQGNRWQQFVRFWVRRALRIFPLYFAWLIGFGAAYLLLNFPTYYEQYFPYLITYTLNFTRTMSGWQGNPLFTHLWSLSVEEQFYLFLPVIVLFLPRRLTQVLLPVLILAAPFTRYWLFHYYSGLGLNATSAADAMYWNILSHLDAFAFGGVIVVLKKVKEFKSPQILLVSAIALVAIAATYVMYQGPRSLQALMTLGFTHNQTDNFAYVWHYTLLNFLFASLILWLVHIRTQTGHLIKTILSYRWLTRIGKVSYGMYIFHWAVLTYVFNRYIPQEGVMMRALVFLPYAASVYLLAELSFRFFESPFLQLKEKLFRSKREGESTLSTSMNAASEVQAP
jgi:peptidoglycan/LPS O-acetylase OafA/YrhL